MWTWFSELQKLTPKVSFNQHDAHKHAKVAHSDCSKGTRTNNCPCRVTTADVWCGSILEGKFTICTKEKNIPSP